MANRQNQDRVVQKPAQNMRGVNSQLSSTAKPHVSLYDAVQAMSPAVNRIRRGVLGAAMQADAAVRAAANAMTFGYADKASAYLDAKLKGGDPRRFEQRYRAELAEEAARNAYDFQHRRAAQTVGQVAGVAIPVLLPGGGAGAMARVAGTARAAPRIIGAASLTGREAASAVGAGAVVGAGMQGVGDIARGHLSSPGDYVGAAAGGAVGVAALPLGVGQANATSGAATPILQNVLNGRPISLQEAAGGATAGRTFGLVADGVGTGVSGALSMQTKGKIGEALGRARSVADWKPRDPFLKERAYIPNDPRNRYMYPDGRRTELTDVGERLIIYEDKFGPTAKLSPNQTLMWEAVPQDFRINHFLPEDVGMIVSAPAASAGAQTTEDPLAWRRWP